MKSGALATLPKRVTTQLVRLGQNISVARRTRRLTVAMMMERMFVSKSTYLRVERGDPSVSMGVYATALFVLGMEGGIGDLADSAKDGVGLTLTATALPKRVRKRGVGRLLRADASIEDWCARTVLAPKRKGYITAAEVKALWDKQSGKCAISGVPLDFTSTGMNRPSLDRIDSKRGYTADNVQITAYAVNLMKSDREQHEALAFLASCAAY